MSEAIHTPVVIGLSIEDRQMSFTFYRDGLDFDPIGEPAEDGIPEPLQFALNDGVRLMHVPFGGFDWVNGDHEVAEHGQTECILGLRTETDAAVDEVVERAHQAGAEIVTEPGEQPWGYAGSFADPDGHIWQVVVES